jgi:membrane protein YqaA with SNARE-associated domain
VEVMGELAVVKHGQHAIRKLNQWLFFVSWFPLWPHHGSLRCITVDAGILESKG